MSDNELMLEEYSLVVNGVSYELKPLPFKYLLNNEFLNDALVIPQPENDFFKGQCFNLVEKDKREKLNKWIRRLVTLNGKEMSLELLCESDWDINDLGELIHMIMEISGLSGQDEKNDTNEKEWAFLFGTLMSNRTMTKTEILESSLPFLNAISKEIMEARAMSLGLGGIGSGEVTEETATSREDFMAVVNG